MKIGVIMPTFQQALWLPGALSSYFNQTYPSTLAIVNDGSTDQTSKVLGHIAQKATQKILRLEHGTNKGSAEAINTGVKALGPKFDALTWISSDNIMEEGWLSTLRSVMEEHKAGAVYGGFWYLSQGQLTYLYTSHTKDRLLNDQACYYGPAFLIRREVWEEAGPHRGRISHDYDHWLRVEEVCYKHNLPIVGVDRPLCWYIAHDQRATVLRKHEYDADHWQKVAKERRGTP